LHFSGQPSVLLNNRPGGANYAGGYFFMIGRRTPSVTAAPCHLPQRGRQGKEKNFAAAVRVGRRGVFQKNHSSGVARTISREEMMTEKSSFKASVSANSIMPSSASSANFGSMGRRAAAGNLCSKASAAALLAPKGSIVLPQPGQVR